MKIMQPMVKMFTIRFNKLLFEYINPENSENLWIKIKIAEGNNTEILLCSRLKDC
jgi:hypothetical protein